MLVLTTGPSSQFVATGEVISDVFDVTGFREAWMIDQYVVHPGGNIPAAQAVLLRVKPLQLLDQQAAAAVKAKYLNRRQAFTAMSAADFNAVVG